MRTPSRGSVSARRPGRPPRGWVRKNLHIDQRKLNVAHKALGACDTRSAPSAFPTSVANDEMALLDFDDSRGACPLLRVVAQFS